MLALLIATGRALYGPLWQSALSRDLGVSDRTMRRWVAGTRNLPSGLRVDLLRLCIDHAAQLDGLADQLRRPEAALVHPCNASPCPSG